MLQRSRGEKQVGFRAGADKPCVWVSRDMIDLRRMLFKKCSVKIRFLWVDMWIKENLGEQKGAGCIGRMSEWAQSDQIEA